MRKVILESPYAGDIEENVRYARACMRDCLLRGEAPIASHLLYTQDGVLSDDDPQERALGIEAGLLWGEMAEATVVYADKGITKGMEQGIQRAKTCGRPVELRYLGNEREAVDNRLAEVLQAILDDGAHGELPCHLTSEARKLLFRRKVLA